MSFTYEKYVEILLNITIAKPTRTMSVNDYPTTKSFYVIEIETHSKQYRYFIYEEGSRVYIELPYEGIYKIERSLLDLVLDYYK